METLYCNKCKDYAKHEKIGILQTCKICGDVYEENRKRYVICGPDTDEEVIKSREALLKEDPTAIIINEDVAIKHRLEGMPTQPSLLELPYINPYKELEDFRYSHLTKAQREADIQPIRTEPKIQRNELCPCGSGKKYKKCCLK